MTVLTENMHISDIIQIEHTIFRKLYVYAYSYVHITSISEKRDYGFECE